MSDTPNPSASPDAALAPGDDVRLVLSTVPPGEARLLARRLVEDRLAACVNVVPGLRSVYLWKGAVADEPETLLLIKTSRARLAALAARLGELHPYEVPELLAFTPESGLPAYLGWIATQAAEV